MKVKLRKILSLALTISLLFQQIGFAQIATELNLANHFARMASSFTVEKFRPLHLRYFSYDTLNDNFKVLLDKGDEYKGLSPKGTVPEEKLKEETQTLLSYFLVGVTLPDSMFWVNLRPDSEDQIIDQYLEKTDVGKIMLSADLQLKKDTAAMTSPATPEGKEYWDRLYKKAAELYGYDNVSIPTLTRPWIVPGEIIVRESQDSAYVYKANLKVMLEQDYLKASSNYNFKDSRSKALNEYSSELIRELIIPKLTKEVNSSKRYAPLRQVYYSLILARWFKLRFSGKTGTYASFINTKDLTNLISKEPWSKTEYFKQYQKSFAEGEYNLKEQVYTPTGQTIRSYFSGGIVVDTIKLDSFINKAMPVKLLDDGFLMKGDSNGIKVTASPLKNPDNKRVLNPNLSDVAFTIAIRIGFGTLYGPGEKGIRDAANKFIRPLVEVFRLKLHRNPTDDEAKKFYDSVTTGLSQDAGRSVNNGKRYINEQAENFAVEILAQELVEIIIKDRLVRLFPLDIKIVNKGNDGYYFVYGEKQLSIADGLKQGLTEHILLYKLLRSGFALEENEKILFVHGLKVSDMDKIKNVLLEKMTSASPEKEKSNSSPINSVTRPVIAAPVTRSAIGASLPAKTVVASDDSVFEIPEEFIGVKFGTSGHRGEYGKQITPGIAAAIAQGIVGFVNQFGGFSGKDKVVIIGGDPRPFNKAFQEEEVRVTLANGFKVLAFERPMPTPIGSFVIRYANEIFGLSGNEQVVGTINNTPSHNPRKDGGIKLNPGGEFEGAPSEPKVNDVIQEIANDIIENGKGIVRLPDSTDFSKHPNYVTIDPQKVFDVYIGHVAKLVDFTKIRQAIREKGLTWNVSTMNGAAGWWMRKAFEAVDKNFFTLFHEEPLPDFGELPLGPNTEKIEKQKEYFKDFFAKASDGKGATDGDGDRFYLADENGNKVNFNVALALVFDYMLNRKGMNGVFLTCVDGTGMFEKIGKVAPRTRIGFKEFQYALKDKNQNVIFAGEGGSGGLTLGGHILDKDGIIAQLLFVEMTADAKLRGLKISDLINELYKKYGYYAMLDTRSIPINSDAKTAMEVKKMVPQMLAERYKVGDEIFTGYKIDSIDTTDGLKFFLKEQATGAIHSMLIRPSGTGKEMRDYTEAVSLNSFEDGLSIANIIAKNEDALVNQLINEAIAKITSSSPDKKSNSSPLTSNLAKAVEEAQSQLPADVNEQILKFIVTGDENGKILYPIWPQDSVMVGHVRDDRAGYFARGLWSRGFKNLLGYIKFTNDFQGKAVLSDEIIASVPNTFFEILSNKGYQVLVVSEDEKKSHTGKNAAGRKKDGLFPGQKQIVIPMQKSKMAYVDTPQMKMKECADEVLNALDDDATDFILVNLLSSDMMKHTGNFQAAKKSNEITDQQIGRIKEKVDRIKRHVLGDMIKEVNKYLSREEASQLYVLLLNNYDEFLTRLKNKNQELYKRIKDLEAKIPIFVITADHGASEAGLTENPKESDTFHTANPVPYIIYDPLRNKKLVLKSGQTIRNNGATLLHLLGEEIPKGSDPSLLPDDYQGSKRRITMAVLDGWGINPDQNYPWDAIRLAYTPNYNWLVENASFTQLQAHGEVIGLRGPLSLEEGRHHLRGLQAGQTDVGHLHLFSLREIKQPLWYVDRLIKGSIRDGVFDESKPEVQVLVKELQRVKDNNLRFHYITIASEGGVHSSLYHMYALMRLAKKIGLRQDQFIIHFAADGRDVPTRTAHLYIQDVEKRIEEIGIGVIATVFGRDMFVRKDGAENITNRIIDVMEGINLDAQDVTQVKSVASSTVTLSGKDKAKIQAALEKYNIYYMDSRLESEFSQRIVKGESSDSIVDFIDFISKIYGNRQSLVNALKILLSCQGSLRDIQSLINKEKYLRPSEMLNLLSFYGRLLRLDIIKEAITSEEESRPPKGSEAELKLPSLHDLLFNRLQEKSKSTSSAVQNNIEELIRRNDKTELRSLLEDATVTSGTLMPVPETSGILGPGSINLDSNDTYYDGEAGFDPLFDKMVEVARKLNRPDILALVVQRLKEISTELEKKEIRERQNLIPNVYSFEAGLTARAKDTVLDRIAQLEENEAQASSAVRMSKGYGKISAKSNEEENLLYYGITKGEVKALKKILIDKLDKLINDTQEKIITKIDDYEIEQVTKEDYKYRIRFTNGALLEIKLQDNSSVVYIHSNGFASTEGQATKIRGKLIRFVRHLIGESVLELKGSNSTEEQAQTTTKEGLEGASSAVHHKIINLYDFDSIKARKIDPDVLKNRFIKKIEELITDVKKGKRREFAGELIQVAIARKNNYTIYFTDKTWVVIKPQGTEIYIDFRCRAGIELSVVEAVRQLIKISQPELLVGTVGSVVQTPEEAASSALTPGGIDFRALPMTIQPMGSFAGLNFKLPQLSQAQLKQINIDSEMQQVKNLVESGIVPSGDRIKELIAACSQKGEISYYVDNLLLCLVDICKLEEQNAFETSPELREALAIVDSLGGQV